MAKVIQFEGKNYSFPDDASDAEISSTLEAMPQLKYDQNLNSVDLNATPGPGAGQELRNPDNSWGGYLANQGAQFVGGATGELRDIFGTGGGNPAMAGGKGGAVPRDKVPTLPEGNYGTMASRFGKELTDNALLEAGTVGVGGALGVAGREFAPSIAPKLREQLLNMVRSYRTAPAAHVGQTVTGTAGQVVGEGAMGQDQGGGLAGYMLAAPAGATAGKLVGKAGTAALEAGGKALETVGLKAPKPKPNFTVLASNPDMLAPVAAADQRVQGEIAQYEQKMQDVVKKFAPTYQKKPGQAETIMPTDVAHSRFETARTNLENSMRGKETKLWSEAVKTPGLSPAGAQTSLRDLQNTLRKTDPEATIPDDVMNEVLGWKGFISAKKVQGTISNIGAMRTKLRKDPTFRGDWRRLSANLGQVEDILRDMLETGVTDPAKLAEARAFTQARKGIFNDGPLGEAKFEAGQGATNFTIPGQSQETNLQFARQPQATTVLGTRGGPEQVQAAQQMANATGTPSTILQDFENTIRAEFAEKVQSKVRVRPGGSAQIGDIDAKATERYWRQYQAQVRPLTNLANELDHAVNSVQVLDDARDKVLKSAYAKLAKGGPAANPETVIRSMFSDPNRVRVARQLTSTFAKDPHAMEAWHNYVIQEVLRRGKNDPEEVIKLLQQDNRYNDVLETVFKDHPERLATFRELLPAMVEAKKSEQAGGVRSVIRGGVRLIAGIQGAAIGRALGTGTVQVPGQVAKGFRGFALRTLGRIMPDAGTQMSYALIDPSVAKWLLKKYSPADGKAAIKQALYFSRRLNTLIAGTYSLKHEDQNDRGARPSR